MDKEILIDRYVLEDIIGEGSYSIVFRGWDQEDKKRVAIKELKSLGMTKEEADEAHRLFFNEINILKDLRHSGIPRVFDFFIFEGRHYMVMEWVEGENLEEMLERKGRISQDEALEYMKKLTNVLCYLQGTLKRVIYRDIKPSNIIVNENGSLKLIDFGISRYYSPEKKKDTHILGTPGYAPPEAYSGNEQTDFSADIYSLGATFYHLTTGEDPVQFRFIFPNPQKFNHQLTEDFANLLTDCLKKKGERIRDAVELKRRMEEIQKKIEEAKKPKQQETKKTAAPLPSIRFEYDPKDVDIVKTKVVCFFASYVICSILYEILVYVNSGFRFISILFIFMTIPMAVLLEQIFGNLVKTTFKKKQSNSDDDSKHHHHLQSSSQDRTHNPSDTIYK